MRGGAGGPAEPWRGSAGPLFDRNAVRYDLVNRIITFGGDGRWRRDLAARAALPAGARVLDACAGTGLLGLELAARGAAVTLLDASPVMLSIAQRRAAALGLTVDVAAADLEAAPAPPGPYDAVGMAFGLRYIREPGAVLQRLRAALAPEGRLLLLEAVCPPRGVVGEAAGFYFFRVAPRVATLLAGRRELYDSLTESVRALGDADRVRALVKAAGLQVEEERTWACGLVIALIARLPAARRGNQPAGARG